MSLADNRGRAHAKYPATGPILCSPLLPLRFVSGVVNYKWL